MSQAGLEAVLLLGPRQIGKTTLLERLPLQSKAFLDDLSLREQAQNDPGLFFENIKTPCLIDEAQYAPNIFPELKLRIDHKRRESLKTSTGPTKKNTEYYLTGSNKLLLDQNVKESLAGRCHIFNLHGLSVKELVSHFKNIPIQTLLFKGGFPEVYTHPDISVIQYLNSYINSFVEKDLAASAGVTKIDEFRTVLRLLATRTGQFVQYSEIAKDAGVNQETIRSWVSVLAHNSIVNLISGYATNMNKRVVKMKKLYFYDTALCARLQGHQHEDGLWGSPQAGSLFETLVYSEIVKTKDNYLKEWTVHTWRTKEKFEIDFIVETPKGLILIESKMGIHGAKPLILDTYSSRTLRNIIKKVVVTVSGETGLIGDNCDKVAISDLGKYLLKLA